MVCGCFKMAVSVSGKVFPCVGIIPCLRAEFCSPQLPEYFQAVVSVFYFLPLIKEIVFLIFYLFKIIPYFIFFTHFSAFATPGCINFQLLFFFSSSTIFFTSASNFFASYTIPFFIVNFTPPSRMIWLLSFNLIAPVP